ncbi:hypothetical protein L1987_79722 [Smallanthus sonchifolius]|uniref:Uncharacterized protein n=1 Tax=Smallanthus sonchifolius TaxID=185202 RepID=A0ACB8YLB0_9ASTR|nr:hypothetical protein L1987_79722 [Smallanthus sonchifolius]
MNKGVWGRSFKEVLIDQEMKQVAGSMEMDKEKERVIEVLEGTATFISLHRRSLVGRLKDLRSLTNLHLILRDDGHVKVGIQYLGGLSVLMNFGDPDHALQFLENSGEWNIWKNEKHKPLEEGEIGESFTVMETQGTKQHGEKLLGLSEPLGDTNGVSKEEKIDDEALKSGGKAVGDNDSSLQEAIDLNIRAYAENQDPGSIDRQQGEINEDAEQSAQGDRIGLSNAQLEIQWNWSRSPSSLVELDELAPLEDALQDIRLIDKKDGWEWNDGHQRVHNAILPDYLIVTMRILEENPRITFRSIDDTLLISFWSIRTEDYWKINSIPSLITSILCSTCGNYIYKGTKFNSHEENFIGETYLGIQIFKIYLKCTKCSAEITMMTDPQNSDYVVETGVARNFEPWRAEDEVGVEEKRKRDAEEMGDGEENRTLDLKREMDILSAFDEMKSMKREEKLEEEDEALIKSIFQVSTTLVS